MSVTVWGDCGGPNTPAASRDRYGQLSARSYRELVLELPAEGAEVDADHNEQRLGEAVYVELGADERLRAVCVLDGDALTNVDRPVYFSPTLEMRGHNRGATYIAREAELLGLSLVFGTARVGALPLRWRAGDLRDPSDRFSLWPCSWQDSEPLLARALAHLGEDRQVRTRSALRVVDRSQASSRGSGGVSTCVPARRRRADRGGGVERAVEARAARSRSLGSLEKPCN